MHIEFLLIWYLTEEYFTYVRDVIIIPKIKVIIILRHQLVVPKIDYVVYAKIKDCCGHQCYEPV